MQTLHLSPLMQLQHTAIMIYTCLRDILSTNVHLVIHVRATPSININFGLLPRSQKYSRFSLEHSYQGDIKMIRMPLSSLSSISSFPNRNQHGRRYVRHCRLTKPRAHPRLASPSLKPAPRWWRPRPDLGWGRSPRLDLHRRDQILPARGAHD
jgi:hypothetical protein